VRSPASGVNAGGHGVPTTVARGPITVRGPRSAGGSLSVLDAISGRLRRTIVLGTTLRSIVLDPLAQRAFVGDLVDDARPGRVLLLDTSGL